MSAKILFILLLFFPQLVWAQKLDSLLAQLESHKSQDTARVTLLTSIAGSFWGSNPPRIKQYGEEALELAQELKFTRGIADAYGCISLYYWSQTDFTRTIDFSMLALKEYERCQNKKGISWCLGTIGLSYAQGKKYEKAIQFQSQALELNREIKNKEGIARNLNNLGNVYEIKKDYNKALAYYQQALTLRMALGSEADILMPIVNVGCAYMELGNYRIAKTYFQRSLAMAEKFDNKNMIAFANQNLGDLSFRTGAYENAKSYINKALQIAIDIGDKKRIEEVYELLKKIEVSRNNFKEAFRHQESLQSLRDTLYSQERATQLAQFEAGMEAEKREQAIALLEQDNKIKLLSRNLLLVGLAFVVVVAGLIYYFQRKKNRKDQQLLRHQEELNSKLVEVDQTKSRLFANISHEFRTPLTLILSPVEEKLLGEDLSQKDKISFQTIGRSANRLLELVNQVLELSKLESGFMKLKPQSGNLYNFIMPVLSSFDSMADMGQVQYTKEVRVPESPLLFDGDKIEKILTNLLSNAFKFSPKAGRVDIKVVATEKEKNIELTIEIKNPGSVIASGTLDKIFEPFFQGDNTPTRGIPGTGLGLSLVKELVKLHGGDIHVASTANEGTVFTVTLPLEKSDMPATIPATERIETIAFAEELSENNPAGADATKETILIVEDNQDVRSLIRHGLEAHYNILEASTGKEGVEVAREKPVDLVVSDVMMPVMNGVELCHLLKNDERTSHVPIILLTARADHESKLEGLRTGADDYVVKPFNMQELQARIVNLIGQRKKLIQKYNQHIVIHPHEITVTPLDERFIQKAIQIVEANLDNTELNVDKMSAELGMGRANLQRKLKSITGLAPSEFIQDFRLRRAALLIENKADTVSQIAYQVGFSDHSYFTKCFKKKFGKVPSEWGEGER
jgi:signal transduction histidine kinase/DNA-binding response OmpR family regulator